VAQRLSLDVKSIARAVSNESLARALLQALQPIASKNLQTNLGRGAMTTPRKLLILAITLLASSCTTTAPGPVDQRNSALTQGNVQMNLAVGKTSKTEVLEKFGAPNITTRDGSGQEVWSYQRYATVAQSNSSQSYWTIFLSGQASTADGFSQTTRTMTLIIKFDAKDVVSDFRSRTSDF
jgi:outer membrane protein assembly factor BamE (lipoprotein component of BamABCDE complex)